ncbi:hypothetical protein CSOJ01_08834 [Colletotrichum sojae]|uniref:Uncharacterized protein n=1 Tax=Colletotrichum sojae TaxID=2175907 RepID=A0A8H6J4K5_9PEZI|nr:hypothetical protein CSOJ01_08834 [Colletotrichum sojae]
MIGGWYPELDGAVSVRPLAKETRRDEPPGLRGVGRRRGCGFRATWTRIDGEYARGKAVDSLSVQWREERSSRPKASKHIITLVPVSGTERIVYTDLSTVTLAEYGCFYSSDDDIALLPCPWMSPTTPGHIPAAMLLICFSLHIRPSCTSGKGGSGYGCLDVDRSENDRIGVKDHKCRARPFSYHERTDSKSLSTHSLMNRRLSHLQPLLDVDQSLFEDSSAVETGIELCATPPGHLGLPPVPSHSLATRGSPAELSSYGVCRFASIPVGLGSSLTARMHTVLSSLSSRSSASRVLPPDAARASPGRRECASLSPKTPRDDTLRYHVRTLNRAIATWGLC